MPKLPATPLSGLSVPDTRSLADVPQPSGFEQVDTLILADRLPIPSSTRALLLDMDGVLLDTLTLDYEIVNGLLHEQTNAEVDIPRSVVRANFAYHIPEFWRRILASVGVELPAAQHEDLVRRYDEVRLSATPRVHQGILEILAAAKQSRLSIAVVSNNPATDVSRLLSNTGLIKFIDEVVGNDKPSLAKKPAPDTYLEAARRLSVSPSLCVVVEDSLLGAQAGNSAGCFTIGVATGANSFEELAQSPFVSHCLPNFRELKEWDASGQESG